jgi:hypothetical protein
MHSEISALAVELGIEDGQLERFQRKLDDDGALLAWLRKRHFETRDRKWFVAQRPSHFVVDEQGRRRYGYTEIASEAMVAMREEGVHPDEVADYRHSRQARARLAQERLDEVADLLAAMTELRSVIDAMPSQRKRNLGRSFWVLRTRLDAAEKDLRRRAA